MFLDDMFQSESEGKMEGNHRKLVSAMDRVDPRESAIGVLNGLGYSEKQITRILSLYADSYMPFLAKNLLSMIGAERLWLVFAPNNDFLLNVREDPARIDQWNVFANSGCNVSITRGLLWQYILQIFMCERSTFIDDVLMVSEHLDDRMIYCVQYGDDINDRYSMSISEYNRTNMKKLYGEINPKPGDILIRTDCVEIYGFALLPSVLTRDTSVVEVEEPVVDAGIEEGLEYKKEEQCDVVKKVQDREDIRDVILGFDLESVECAYEIGDEPLPPYVIGEVYDYCYPCVEFEQQIVKHVEDLRTVVGVSTRWRDASMKESLCRLRCADFVFHRTIFDSYGQPWLAPARRNTYKGLVPYKLAPIKRIEYSPGMYSQEYDQLLSLYLEYDFYNVRLHRGQIVSVESVTRTPIYEVGESTDYLIYNWAMGFQIMNLTCDTFVPEGVRVVKGKRHPTGFGTRVKFKRMCHQTFMQYLMQCTLSRRFSDN